MIKAIIFDLDDTLCDTSSYILGRELNLFPDAVKALDSLKEHILILLTYGVTEMQENKIGKLGIGKYFNDIVFDDVEDNCGKEQKMREIMEKYGFRPEEVICVGDKIFSEIEAANKLGIMSVQCIRGRWKDAEPDNKYQKPDYRIHRLNEINEILKRFK